MLLKIQIEKEMNMTLIWKQGPKIWNLLKSLHTKQLSANELEEPGGIEVLDRKLDGL